MEVQLKIDGKKGFFYIDVNRKQEAKMTFVFAKSVFDKVPEFRNVL